jgi:hypothetical protein
MPRLVPYVSNPCFGMIQEPSVMNKCLTWFMGIFVVVEPQTLCVRRRQLMWTSMLTPPASFPTLASLFIQPPRGIVLPSTARERQAGCHGFATWNKQYRTKKKIKKLDRQTAAKIKPKVCRQRLTDARCVESAPLLKELPPFVSKIELEMVHWCHLFKLHLLSTRSCRRRYSGVTWFTLQC